MLYATVQTGYQPGTYNLFPSTAANNNLVEPAKLTAYTLGAKSRFADGRLQINNELFYYDYRDLFVQSFNLNTALLTTFNAEAVEIYGDQLDVRWNASQGTQLSLSIGYLHARNEKFVVPDGVDIGPGPRDFAGYSLQYAPDLTVTAGLQHDFNVGAGYLRARLHARDEGEFWGTCNHARATRQQADSNSDASVRAAGKKRVRPPNAPPSILPLNCCGFTRPAKPSLASLFRPTTRGRRSSKHPFLSQKRRTR
jgi:iron complex outermembrane receptor protein